MVYLATKDQRVKQMLKAKKVKIAFINTQAQKASVLAKAVRKSVFDRFRTDSLNEFAATEEY